MQGFRLRQGGIEMRVGRLGANDDTFGCDSGRWERITSPDIQITQLSFRLVATARNANPAKTRDDPCAPGDHCQQIRSVDIQVAGQLSDDPASARALSTRVAVRADRYVLTP
jgi:hypothetical protein